MNSIKALDSDSEDLKQEFDLLKKEYEKNIEYIKYERLLTYLEYG